MNYTTKCAVTPEDTLTVYSLGRFVLFSVNGGISVALDRDQLAQLDAELDAHAEAYAEPKAAKPVPVNPQYSRLSDQSRTIYRHMDRAGSISAREAMDDYGITSATLARRICDIEEEGFEIWRERRVHPMTGKRYTRYSLLDRNA